MSSVYPGALDTLATNKANATAQTTDHPAHHNNLADAVNKVEAELGVNPSGEDATVAAGFDRVNNEILWADDPRYGAVGDGAADDTAALQAHINAVTAAHGKGMLAPGVYKITDDLLIPKTYQWSWRGVGAGMVTLKQYTDNREILNIGGGSGADPIHTWDVGDLAFDYANSQAAANTLANPILFSDMAFEGSLTRCRFLRGSYAIRTASGVTNPWGNKWDELVFGSGLTAGAMDMSGSSVGTPNNHFGRMFVDALNMAGPIFKEITGDSFVIDAIEIIRATSGAQLMSIQAGTEVTIAAFKLEGYSYTASKTMIIVGPNSRVLIGILGIRGDPAAIDTGTVSVIDAQEGADTFVEVRSAHVSDPTLTSGGKMFLLKGTGEKQVGHLDAGANCKLQDNGATADGETITVRRFANDRLSTDKGNANYTVTLGDPTRVAFATAFTAQRTITLPADGDNLFNGLRYRLVFNGAINGANNALIKAGATTLRTQLADKVALEYTWRRHSTAASGWVLTGYEQLAGPPSVRATLAANWSHATSGTWIAIPWDAEDYDNDGMHSGSSTDFTVVTPGLYSIAVGAFFAANATGYRGLRILNGGADIPGGVTYAPAISGAQTAIGATTQQRLAVGDVISVVAFQDSGGALNVQTGFTAFAMARLGDS